MDGRPLPGFYYDPDKQKYFRIQPQHALPPTAKYSTSNLAKEGRKAKRQKATAKHQEKTRNETVTRRPIDPLTQACLDREIGFRRRSYYVQTAWPKACTSHMRSQPTKIVDRPSDGAIRHFARDPFTQTLYAVHGESRIARRRIHTGTTAIPPPSFYDTDTNTNTNTAGPDGEESLSSLPRNPYTIAPWDELGRTTSAVSSLAYMPATGALALTTYRSDTSPSICFSDPDHYGPYLHQLFTPHNCGTIWASSARPTSFHPSPSHTSTIPETQIERLAVAASTSLLLFTRSPFTGAWDCRTASNHSTDILSLTWLSPYTLAFGARSGAIRIHDIRSLCTSRILTHSTPVVNLQRAEDATRLVCAGLDNTLYLYDIRSPRPASSSSSNHQPPRKKPRFSHPSSLPVLRIPHANPDDPSLAVAIHPRLNLVAAAQDPGSSSVAIRVSSLWTGETVREFGNERRGGVWKGERIRCLQFFDCEDGIENRNTGTEGAELWTCWDGGVGSFIW